MAITEEDAQKRDEFVKGLRELADVFEANGGVALPLPEYGLSLELNVTVWKDGKMFVEADEELTKKVVKRAIRGMGRGKKNKIYSDYQFTCIKEFSGGVKLKVITTRAAVCRKVPTGNKIIHAASTYTTPERVEEEFEWVCDDPILAESKMKSAIKD